MCRELSNESKKGSLQTPVSSPEAEIAEQKKWLGQLEAEQRSGAGGFPSAICLAERQAPQLSRPLYCYHRLVANGTPFWRCAERLVCSHRMGGTRNGGGYSGGHYYGINITLRPPPATTPPKHLLKLHHRKVDS